MTIKKVDVHCHVDQYSPSELATIFKDDSCLLVGAATGVDSGARLLQLAEQYQNLRVCLGIHPEKPEGYLERDRVTEQISANLDRIVAIGEIGLPWYCLKEMTASEKTDMRKRAEELLGHFLKLARTSDLPVILHAIKETALFALEQLKEHRIERALFHWFEGSPPDLRQIIKSGYFISISPDLMVNRAYAEFTDNIPLDSLTLESDGPWEYDGTRGVPAMIEATAACLAKRRGLDPEEILKANLDNSLKLFGSESLIPLER
ncbi:MAG: TatD family hydrolase [bacterium]